MANPENIEQELRAYLEEADHLSRQDRFKHLKAIFDKHFAMDQTTHIVKYGDMGEIVSYAKSLFVQTTLPMKISNKEVYHSDVNHVLIMDAFISYLNRNKLLKRLIKFDFTR